MPLKIGDRTYADFDAAVRGVMRKFGWSMERARAYVGSIQKKQEANQVKGMNTDCGCYPEISVRLEAANAAVDRMPHATHATDNAGRQLWREEGHEFIVPARVTSAGVMNGAHKSPEEIVRLFDEWPDEVPLTLLHPAGGIDPKPEEIIGSSRGKRLLVDEDLMPVIEVDHHYDLRTPNGRAAAEANKRGEWLDNSIAYRHNIVPEIGTFRGRAYDRREANLKVAHVAVLPTGHGACSKDQRCGIMVNDGAGTGTSPTTGPPPPAAAAPPAAPPAVPIPVPATNLTPSVPTEPTPEQIARITALVLKGATPEALLAAGNAGATEAKKATDELKKLQDAEAVRVKAENEAHDHALRAVGKNKITDEDIKAMSLDEKKRTLKLMGVQGANAGEAVKQLHAAFDKALQAKNKAITADELAAMSLPEKERALKFAGLNAGEITSSLPFAAMAPGAPTNQGGADNGSELTVGDVWNAPLTNQGVSRKDEQKKA